MTKSGRYFLSGSDSASASAPALSSAQAPAPTNAPASPMSKTNGQVSSPNKKAVTVDPHADVQPSLSLTVGNEDEEQSEIEVTDEHNNSDNNSNNEEGEGEGEEEEIDWRTSDDIEEWPTGSGGDPFASIETHDENQDEQQPNRKEKENGKEKRNHEQMLTSTEQDNNSYVSVKRLRREDEEIRKEVNDYTDVYCKICDLYFRDSHIKVTHEQSKKHIKKLKQIQAMDDDNDDHTLTAQSSYEHEHIEDTKEMDTKITEENINNKPHKDLVTEINTFMKDEIHKVDKITIPDSFKEWAENSLCNAISEGDKVTIALVKKEITFELLQQRKQCNLYKYNWNRKPLATGRTMDIQPSLNNDLIGVPPEPSYTISTYSHRQDKKEEKQEIKVEVKVKMDDVPVPEN